ncbi:uncharacterized protein [Hetaerina americana]|uniref:uncharacterized protein n=1 Tax=Hetaerina americana TaxID=62018 RepID=UPI003A7F1DA3
MPSKEELCLSTNAASGTTTGDSDFLSRDMEELVYEIKENLRLSGFKGQPSLPSAFATVVKHKRTNASRASPYRIPVRPGPMDEPIAADSCKSCLRGISRGKTKQDVTEDPYAMLQELLREGSLIKEAVRRLQLGLSPKQRYFYDEDDVSTVNSGGIRVCDV